MASFELPSAHLAALTGSRDQRIDGRRVQPLNFFAALQSGVAFERISIFYMVSYPTIILALIYTGQYIYIVILSLSSRGHSPREARDADNPDVQRTRGC